MNWKIKITIIGFCTIFLVMQVHEYLNYFEEGLASPVPSFKFQSNQEAQLLEQNRFAYYVLTASCLRDDLLMKDALGDADLIDVYILSYKEKCKKPHPSNFKYITPNFTTTWTTGRNILYRDSRNSGKHYRYHIFMDDDVIPVYTEHILDFEKTYKQDVAQKGLMRAYIEAEEGLRQGKEQRRNNISVLRAFENDLIKYSPAFSECNFWFGANYMDHLKHAWNNTCPKDKQMPWVVSTALFDEMFIAFHDNAARILLPYTDMFDDISWWASAWINIFRSRALLFKHGMINLRITVLNTEHRAYPRQKIPNDMLYKYLEKDGKDLVNLIDEDELENFFKQCRHCGYDNVLNHLQTRELCTGPIKYPLDEFYRRS